MILDTEQKHMEVAYGQHIYKKRDRKKNRVINQAL
jgi:hypothetical protein